MITLSTLADTSRTRKKVQRVGRGPGSGRGKTSCRGQKGDKSRSGYKRRYGREGGQLPLYRKLPCRGFNSGMFRTETFAINLSLINTLFNDGDVVNYETLREKGYAPRLIPGGVKILGFGDLKKKVKIQVNHLSKTAKAKLEESSIPVELV